MARYHGYAEMQDDHIHNPNCKGGSHRTGPSGSAPTYPGTTLQTHPKKWTWREYKAYHVRRNAAKET